MESFLQLDSIDFDDLLDCLDCSSCQEEVISTGISITRDVSSDDSSVTAYDEIESSSSQHMLIKKKRKRRTKIEMENAVETPLKPRIMRADRRRFYCDMFTNVLNSGDFRLLFGLFETYCIPNFSQTSHVGGPTDLKPVIIEVNGPGTVAKFWHGLFQLGPDSVTQVLKADLHLSSDSKTSKIVTQFVYSATKIFQITELASLFQIDESNITETKSDKFSLNQPCDYITMERDIERVTGCLTLGANPYKMSTVGIFTMHIDENKHIYKMEMETQPYVKQYLNATAAVVGGDGREEGEC
jgi:hypothetical protein